MSTKETLYEALAKAQRNMSKAVKDSTNPHFRSKYADLSSVMDACMPALTAEGICVFFSMHESELGTQSVVTTLAHKGGEKIECRVPLLLGKKDMQGLGSAITYARRYGLMNLAGVAPDDDDGNAAASTVGKEPPRPRETSWVGAVLEEMPEGSTDREKALALANAMKAEFSRKKTLQQLQNELDRRKDVFDRIGEKFADIQTDIADAYENRVLALTPDDPAKVAAQ